MSKYVWVTDPHLNQCRPQAREELLRQIALQEPQGLWITGDFAEAPELASNLELLAQSFEFPIYFVLGNHDFYFGSIHRVRGEVTRLCRDYPHLNYLTGKTFETLDSSLGLVGEDGWADGRIGDYDRSLVMMYDYRLIEELSKLSKADRKEVLHRLGDQSAERARVALSEAWKRLDHVILLTHVPPLREACWHEGSISDDEWAPHFTCAAMGEMLLTMMGSRPDKQLTVLCGHTHSPGICQPLPNLKIFTGGAEYGTPRITGLFDQAGRPLSDIV